MQVTCHAFGSSAVIMPVEVLTNDAAAPEAKAAPEAAAARPGGNATKGAVGLISKSYAHRLTIWLAVLHPYASETFHNCKINKNPIQDIPILCIFTPQNLTYGETREKTLPVGCLCLDI